MSMQISSASNNYASRISESRLLQQVRSAQIDTPVERVQPVRSAKISDDSLPKLLSTSVLTSDQVQLSARAQQFLAAHESFEQGTQQNPENKSVQQELKKSSSAAVVRSPLQAAENIPREMAAVYPSYSVPTHQSTPSGNSVVAQNAIAAATPGKRAAAVSQKENTAEQKVISTGMQRYLQVQNSVMPQVQTTAVAMNLFA